MKHAFKPDMFYYGFPVFLLSTCDADGHTNITPASSSWCLGEHLVIGLSTRGKAFANLQICPEAVLNLPDETLWEKVERIAPLTGVNPVPDYKQGQYQYCADKFAHGGFTREAALHIRPARIAECPLQAETRVEAITERDGYAIIELQILVVHADQRLMLDARKINPEHWQPLIYNFRHYQGLKTAHGKNFRAES
ncbi:MAG: flavin reductase [Cardiobacteriaceae bacterium]|nr:flavin reductase [Cardiobacteriaceae bacterium]